MNSVRSTLRMAAVLAGLAELGMGVQFATAGDSSDVPAPAFMAGAAFLVLAWFLRSEKAWPTFGLAGLFGLELVTLPFFERTSWVDWAEQGGFSAVSAIGLIAALAVLAGRRQRIA